MRSRLRPVYPCLLLNADVYNHVAIASAISLNCRQTFVSESQSLSGFDPAMNTDADADSVFYALYENLMRESDDGSGEVTLTNGMAKEYTEGGEPLESGASTGN